MTVYFHLIYWALLIVLSIHIMVSLESERRWSILLTTIVVMLALRLIPVLTVAYPVIYDPDPKYGLQIVQRILSSGIVPFGPGSTTGEAYVYSFYPGLEILLSTLSAISFIDPTMLMKLGGSFMGISTVLLFFCAYRRISKHIPSELSISLAALSPWFISFDTFTVHQTLAFALLALIVLSLTSRSRPWNFIAFVGMLSIAVSHSATSYLFPFVLLGIFLLSRQASNASRSRPLSGLTVRTIVYFAILASAWTTFVAIQYLPEVGRFFQAAFAVLFAPEIRGIPEPFNPTGLKPLWVVAAYLLGFLAFGLITFGKVTEGLMRRKLNSELILAATGVVVFAIFLAPYLSGLRIATDLYGRGLTYLYFLSAPVVAEFVFRLCRRGWNSHPNLNKVRRIALPSFLLLIIFVPAVYYGVSPGLYDRHAPLTGTRLYGDIRLSPYEWQEVADFAKTRVSVQTVYGVRLAWDFVGGLTGKNVIPMELNQTKLNAYLQDQRGGLLFLRKSIVQVGDYSTVTIDDMNAMYADSNVLYSSGDVIIAVAP